MKLLIYAGTIYRSVFRRKTTWDPCIKLPINSMEHSRVGSGVTLPQKAKAIDIPVRDLNNMDRNSLISCINSLQLEVQHLTERLSELESENRKIRIMACEQVEDF